MTTLSGGPRPKPEDIKDGQDLTAALFKQATQFWVADDVPSDGEGNDGDVVFVLKEEELGGGGSAELPGLGGWAEILDVGGSPKRYDYNDGETDWVAFEWTDTSTTHTLTTDAGGLVDALIVGAGGSAGGATNYTHMGYGGAGGVLHGPVDVGTSNEIKVGVGGNFGSSANGDYEQHSKLNDAVAVGGGSGCTNDNQTTGGGSGGSGGGAATYGATGQGIQGGAGAKGTRPAGGGAGGDANGTTAGPGREFAYTSNTPQMYAVGGSSATPNTPNTGNGRGGTMSYTSRMPGNSGVVIVRVPAAYAEKVPSGSWVTRSNYFAVVENGVVTETYTEHHYGNGTITPLPQTDLIPCDANVTEGYSYENGEFVSPPAPEIPAAQQEILDKINELQQELRSYDV